MEMRLTPPNLVSGGWIVTFYLKNNKKKPVQLCGLATEKSVCNTGNAIAN